ncbi:Oidioi.mRNA.OKI2018_I69.chr1.g2150.t1.cds [Oikopleura dioica]|uniref:Oidioi.mRNA.OKI2018_I69.chr1.g2150.t1.cds n=1 Tax=Oikopleura dioica TaxID=34765 RepID=A0ABN7SZB2_OIKDI|nr:Oidioi.mRNA.OKI2018_I69.chr1.g2150.t1.cds [Oikopleura dioica]
MEIPFADESQPVLTKTIAPPAQEKIAGCCAKFTLSATGIDSPIPSISEFHYDPSKPDAKNFNGQNGYKVYPYATGSEEYFVFGEGTSVSNAACFSKRLKKTECLDDESLTWQCKSGGQWMDVVTVRFSCKMETTTTPKPVITTIKTTSTTTTTTRKTTTKPATPKTTKKIAISYTTPKIWSKFTS